MHKSGLRLSRWHRVVRAAQPLQDNEDEQSNGTLSKGDQGIQRFKRHDGAHPEDEAEPSEMQGGDDVQEDAPDSAPVLSVLDAKGGPGAEEKLHLAPMGAQGAEGQSVTLASYVTPLSPLNTGPPQNIAPAPSVSAVGAQTANKTHSHSPVEMDDVVWPIAVGIMFAVLVLVYTLSMSRSLIRAISSGIYNRGWFLRSSPPEISLYKASYAAPVQRVGKLRSRTRGFYNRFLLPSVPLIDLTVGQCAVLLLYLACITMACFIQSGGPAKDVIRSGRIAVAQFPFLVTLSTKNNLLGMTGKSYDKLNFLHRFAGRSSLICGLIHSIFYLLKLNDTGFLNIGQKPVQLTGVIAMGVSIMTLFTSLRFIRNVAYQFFMISHIIGWIALFVSVYMHVPYAKPWIIASLAVMGLDFAVRICKMRVRTATLFAQEGGVARVELDGIKSGWNAGQHVWVRRLSAGSIIENHPFSISNSAEYAPLVRYHLNETAPCEGMILYSKAFGRWTRNLYQASIPKTPIKDNPFGDDKEEKKSPELEEGEKIKLIVDGPYGINLCCWSEFETVLLIAGGSGITHILSALEDIVARSIQARAVTRRIKLLFIARNTDTIESFLYTLEDILYSARQAAQFLEISVEVYETRSTESSSSSAMTPGLPMLTPALAMTPGLTSPCLKGELHSKGIRIIRGQRPNLVTCLNHSLNDTRPDTRNELAGGVALVTCGPVSLINSARQAARDADQNLAYRAGGIVVHSEKFGW